MKIRKNIFKIIVLGVSILFGLLMIQNEAVNETNSTNNTARQNTTNTQTSQNTTTQNTSNANDAKPEKSSNANLGNLGIRPHDFTGFRYGTTSYEVVVPEDTESVEVYASVQDEKATLTGTGKKTLEKGENRVEVVVTAEDGTTKTYTINIIREVQQENYEDTDELSNKENGKGLAKLTINNLKLSPEFKTNVYEYTVKYIGEDTKLNIETEVTDEDYVIEVMGNENLQEGENFITILVSEANGDNIATYQVKINKSLVDEEAIAKEEAEKKNKQQMVIMGSIGAVVVIIAVVITIILVRRRNRNLEEEFSGRISYDIDNDEEDYEEEYEEEVPKALKGKRFQDSEMVDEQEDHELEFEKMPKDKVREEFLNGYTSQVDLDFDENRYQDNRRKGKHKGKRFK